MGERFPELTFNFGKMTLGCSSYFLPVPFLKIVKNNDILRYSHSSILHEKLE